MSKVRYILDEFRRTHGWEDLRIAIALVLAGYVAYYLAMPELVVFTVLVAVWLTWIAIDVLAAPKISETNLRNLAILVIAYIFLLADNDGWWVRGFFWDLLWIGSLIFLLVPAEALIGTIEFAAKNYARNMKDYIEGFFKAGLK